MKKGLLEQYDTLTRQYLELGHAEVVLKDVPIDRVTYFMPDREVIREESLTTKLRVVFDTSQHAQVFPSLNDCLDKGVNLNPELLEVLLHFRWFPVAINSDIEKAFLQIEIQETDRDAFRFLWFDAIPELISCVSRANSGDEARSAQATRRDLSKKLRYRQKLVDHLWIRWKKEYLLELRTLHLYPSHPSSSIQVDDVVLIEEPILSRSIWPLGRVVDIFPGEDVIT
ncbi:hypothetical protein HPB49_013927 [Dermacentor silvarum]|uniref:Uncharacterized protein n=1 Tax=Dermacentor silvarum TaxID=543639 RepID=A0ACB8CFM0_DERSI|nr:hypothetical protein HPB49_013927 [Dermacentor silvarum]